MVICAIVLRIFLLTLLVLRLLASKMCSACYRLIQQLFFPSPLYLRSSGSSYSPFIHTPSSYSSSPSAVVSSLSYSSYNTTRFSFGSVPTFSSQWPGKALWVVWDSHPTFTPLGFLIATATPVLSIFTSCSGYAFYISVGSKCAILHSLFLHCFNANTLHMKHVHVETVQE